MNFADAMRTVLIEDAAPTTALDDMELQYEVQAGTAYSLDSMWRAVGRPDGKDPASWLRMAAPLLEGLGGYFRTLDECQAVPANLRPAWAGEDLVFTLQYDPGPKNSWWVGDQVAVRYVAWAYARFLDNADA